MSDSDELRKLSEELLQIQNVLAKTSNELIRAEQKLLEYEQIFSVYSDGAWVVSGDFRVMKVNPALLSFLGKDESEVVGQKCYKVLRYCQTHHDICPLRMTTPPNQTTDVTLKSSSGEVRDFILTTTPITLLDGSHGALGQFKDITERKQIERALEMSNSELKKLSVCDVLTGLYNRRALDEQFQRLWRTQEKVAVFMIDVDHFKYFNDLYGHQSGDVCLQDVAKALENSTKLFPEAFVSRYGGEEFTILIPNVDTETASSLAQTLCRDVRLLQIPHQASLVSQIVTISIGVAVINVKDEPNWMTALQEADAALYFAKEHGRDSHHVFDTSIS